jgi:hypothetical protein
MPEKQNSQLQFVDEWIILLQHKNKMVYIKIIGAYSLAESRKEDTSQFYTQQQEQVSKLVETLTHAKS